jgi:hypothetical protein
MLLLIYCKRKHVEEQGILLFLPVASISLCILYQIITSFFIFLLRKKLVETNKIIIFKFTVIAIKKSHGRWTAGRKEIGGCRMWSVDVSDLHCRKEKCHFSQPAEFRNTEGKQC